MSKRYHGCDDHPNKRQRLYESSRDYPFLGYVEPCDREMLYDEKKDLCLLIVNLDEAGLQQIMDIIAKEEPHTLRTQNAECSFDVNALKSRTLWRIKHFLSSWTGNTNLRDSERARARLRAEFEDKNTETLSEWKVEALTEITDTPFPGLELQTDGLCQQSVIEEKMDCCFADSFLAEIPLGVKEEKITYCDGKVEDENECEDGDDEDSHNITDEDTDSDSSGQESVTLTPQKDPVSGKYFISVMVYDLRGGSLKCPSCKKKFKDRSNLIKHVRTHTGEKPYECKHCKKSFRHTSTLKDHMNVHSHQNPYTCSVPGCGKQFANKPNLKRHERTHTGEKPFSCSICGQTFSQSSNCKSHEMSHSGQATRKLRKTKLS